MISTADNGLLFEKIIRRRTISFLAGVLLCIMLSGSAFACKVTSVSWYVGRTPESAQPGNMEVEVPFGESSFYARVKWAADGPDNAGFIIYIYDGGGNLITTETQPNPEAREIVFEVTEITEIGAYSLQAKVRRIGTSHKHPSNWCVVWVVGVDYVRSGGGVTSYTDSPGPNETLLTGKGNPGDTITIWAGTDPYIADWPADEPTWTNATAVPGQPFKATFPIDTISASASGTVVRAECGTTAKAIIIVVFEVASVEPSSTTKVLFTTIEGDNDYPSPYQTEDAKIKIVATVTPVVEGAMVYFRRQNPDPDDGSLYDPPAGDDNTGMPKLGTITACNYTNANGQADVNFGIADRDYGGAGDNYIIKACQREGCTPTPKESGLLVAWQRIYVEEDKMYRIGTDLVADFTHDGDSNSDWLEVFDANVFNIGDSVVIFDADNPAGETRTILDINLPEDKIEVDDLDGDYKYGYWISGGRGASVGKPAGGFYDADVEGRTKDAFGDAADGSDGGCFVEFIIPGDGDTNVPEREALDNPDTPIQYNFMPKFCDMWFKNKDKIGNNYIWVCGAKYCNYKGDNIWGCTMELGLNNFSYTFVGEIEYQCIKNGIPAAIPTVNADTVVHEIGHQFVGGYYVDLNHPNVTCHEGAGTDYCLMDSDANATDAYSEFCWEDPNHIKKIRRKTGGI